MGFGGARFPAAVVCLAAARWVTLREVGSRFARCREAFSSRSECGLAPGRGGRSLLALS